MLLHIIKGNKYFLKDLPPSTLCINASYKLFALLSVFRKLQAIMQCLWFSVIRSLKLVSMSRSPVECIHIKINYQLEFTYTIKYSGNPLSRTSLTSSLTRTNFLSRKKSPLTRKNTMLNGHPL